MHTHTQLKQQSWRYGHCQEFVKEESAWQDARICMERCKNLHGERQECRRDARNSELIKAWEYYHFQCNLLTQFVIFTLQ